MCNEARRIRTNLRSQVTLSARDQVVAKVAFALQPGGCSWFDCRVDSSEKAARGVSAGRRVRSHEPWATLHSWTLRSPSPARRRNQPDRRSLGKSFLYDGEDLRPLCHRQLLDRAQGLGDLFPQHAQVAIVRFEAVEHASTLLHGEIP